TGQLMGVLGTVTATPPEPDALRLAELAHDLRSPLQSIRLLCTLMDRVAPGDPELPAAVQTLRTAADRALQIALELLEHCRGPATKALRPASTWFALEPVLSTIAGEQSVLARNKGLNLACDFQAVQGWEVQTDRVRFGRVVS